jgi:hypothetical protein
MSGYIRLHRKCLENRFFKKPQVWHYFQYCLLRANYEDVDLPLNGELVHLEKGSFLTSLKSDSDRTGLTISAIRHARSVLENDAMISTSNNSKYSIIEVCKYKEFQADADDFAAYPAAQFSAGTTATDKKEKIKNKKQKEDKNKGTRLSLESWLFAVRMKSKEYGYQIKKDEFIDLYNEGLDPSEALERHVCS